MVGAALHPLAAALASALLHSLWQVAVLAVAAAVALRGLARTSAAWRHNVAMALLVTMALAPAAQFFRFWRQPPHGDDGLMGVLATPLLGTAADAFVRSSNRVAAALALVWLAGVAWMLAGHVAGLRAIAAVERAPREVLPPHWLARVERLRGAMGIAREVAVRLSDDVLTPWTARLVRPVIWLPLSLLTRAPAEQVEALLAHELAHIARRDWLWNGVQCAVEALLFYHPAARWLGRRIRREREHACDDMAVAACGDAIALAEALAALERHRRAAPPVSRLVLAANGGTLMRRISRLLSDPPSRRRWGAFAALGALTVAGVLALTQVGIAAGRFPDLMVRASTDGPLGPGDYREISAADKQRFYRGSRDAQGRLTETYSEAGVARPIDASVRAWIDEVSRPPVIPAQPDYPRIEDMAAFKALIAQVGANPAVAARLGTPVARTAKPVAGNVSLGDADGSADIHIELAGPKGGATVAVQADRSGQAWTLKRVVVE